MLTHHYWYNWFTYSLREMATPTPSNQAKGWPRNKGIPYMPSTSQLHPVGQLTIDRTISLYVAFYIT